MSRWGWVLGGVFVALVFLSVTLFPRLLVHDLTRQEKAQLQLDGGIEKRVAAEDSRHSTQNDVRTTVIQGLAGLALLSGAYLTYRQLAATREGQITTRYTEAVKQLGDDKRAVCIGGIYALERIARDSARDRFTVTTVLAALVREKSPRPGTSDVSSDENLKLLADPSRSPEAQAAMTVIGRSKVPWTDLQWTDLRKGFLASAELPEVNLSHAWLHEALLTNARLDKAKLRKVVFCRADMTGAVLRGADIEGADFTGAVGASFSGTKGVPAHLPDGSEPSEADMAQRRT